MRFSDRVAIVTGAANGIGLSVSRLLAREGARVVMADFSPESLHASAELLRQQELDVTPVVCDVTDEAAVQSICADTLSKYGKIDILVNNAGIFRCDVGVFSQSDSAAWKKKIDVNILGTMYFARAVLPSMLERKSGRIINVGSVAGVYGIRRMVDYSMTKGAVISFTTALAKEVAPQGVTVNTVSPGNIRSREDWPENLELSFTPRSGRPDEVAELIAFLASDSAAYINGQNYVIDGSRKAM